MICFVIGDAYIQMTDFMVNRSDTNKQDNNKQFVSVFITGLIFYRKCVHEIWCLKTV